MGLQGRLNKVLAVLVIVLNSKKCIKKLLKILKKDSFILSLSDFIYRFILQSMEDSKDISSFPLRFSSLKFPQRNSQKALRGSRNI